MKILLIAWFDPNGIKAIIDHVTAIQKLSIHKIEILNTYEFGFKLRKYLKFNLKSYDGIIFHNTVTYNMSLLVGMNHKFSPTLKDFTGIKVLMKQDEMRRVNEVKKLISDWRINVISTCLDCDNVAKVYGDDVTGLKIIHTLTGYVTKEMRERVPRPLEDRPLDVVYRGMETPLEWGSLGYEKYIIGEKFKEFISGYNLRTDISSKNKDRIYGPEWIDFLSSSRSTLAVESGASIFDFDGIVERLCHNFKVSKPTGTFEQAYKDFLYKFEGNIKYNQISPRHIEATSLGTVQIMFEGEYSNIYRPYVHYIPLKKNFSNVSEVVSLLKDLEYCKTLVTASRDEILSRDDLTFDFFVKQLDEVLE